MSFSKDVKNEILDKNIEQDCCGLAFLSGLLSSSANIELTDNLHLYLSTELENLAPFINNIISKLYGEEVKSEICKSYQIKKEDNETIIFWCKYYGVFPTTAPVTQLSWGGGNVVTNPQIDISYRYSFKENFNPYTILEFNTNARVDNKIGNELIYSPTYDKSLGHVGKPWVGAPYIELSQNSNSSQPYVYKLRFRE